MDPSPSIPIPQPLRTKFLAMYPRGAVNLSEYNNPVAERRLQLNLTQDNIVDVGNISKGMVVRVEQGLISKVPMRIARVLYNGSSDIVDLQRRYEAWRVAIRESNSCYVAAVAEHPSWSGDWHELRATIVPESKIGFCKLYALHSQVLENFESLKQYPRWKLTPYVAQAVAPDNRLRELIDKKLERYARRVQDTNGWSD